MADQYHLDGEGLRRAVVAGADWVRHTRRHLNAINVFPVADGDTGTNMALSLSATAQAVRDGTDRDLSRVLGTVAEASIVGAKGNSGLILAHWFQGLHHAVGDRARLGADELGTVLERATHSVYGAIEKPVEGTILTVIRAASEAAKEAPASRGDFATAIEHILTRSEEALRRTPEMLEALREAQVVDAGAQGFVNFLRGVQRSLRGLPPPDVGEEELHDAASHPPVSEDEVDGQFCTEVVVRGRRFQRDRLRDRFAPLGSSLLVATTGELFKLHIHTNHPDNVLQLARELGTVVERKVDDMLRQRAERGQDEIEPLVPPAQQPSTVAVLADSASDIPDELARELGIERVPLQVLFGDEVYRDGVDLDTAGFYEKLQSSPHFPSTSQPPPRAFVEALERVRTDRDAIVLTISSTLSGTYRSALAGARLANQPRVEVFDSATASMGLGLQAITAARLAREGVSCDELLRWLGRWRSGTGVFFVPATLEYLRRGGRIGRARSMLGNLLGVRPVLTFDGEQIRPVARVRHDEQAVDRILEQLARVAPRGERLRVGLAATTEGPLDRIEERLRGDYELLEVLRNPLTGVVGAHIGPGGWGVFYQRVPDDDPLEPRR